jgi:hemerythrin-like domain-containing protein
MRPDDKATRRRMLALLGSGTTLLGVPTILAATGKKADKKEDTKDEEDVSPAEDLMREHGLLNRILLVYEEGIRRLAKGGADLHPEVIASAAGIVKRFVEDYHEKLEEEHLFPRFEKAGRLTDLVHVLKAQHAAGRTVTADVQRLANAKALESVDERGRLRAALESFIRMYRPHEAREDTVLFPAFRDIVKGKEYDELGDRFEEKENQLFGDKGFAKMVEEVAGLEMKFGIHELGQFTPK